MRISKFFVAATAVSLVASPLMARGSASKLSLARAGITMQGASSQDDDGSNGSGVIIGIAAAVAVGLGIYVAVDNGGDDDDLPTSP